MAQPNHGTPLVAYENAIATATLENVDYVLSLRGRAIPHEDSPTFEEENKRRTELDKAYARKVKGFGFTYDEARIRFAESGLDGHVMAAIDSERYSQEIAQHRAEQRKTEEARAAQAAESAATERKEFERVVARVPEIVANAVINGNFEELAGLAARYSDDENLPSSVREKRAKVTTAIKQAYSDLPTHDKVKFVMGLTAAIQEAEANTTRIKEALPQPKAASTDNPYADEANWIDPRQLTEAIEKNNVLYNLETIIDMQPSSLRVPAKQEATYAALRFK